MRDIYIGQTDTGTTICDVDRAVLERAGVEAIRAVPFEDYLGLGHHAVTVTVEGGEPKLELAEPVRGAVALARIDAALAALDAKYLTPRVLSGIGVGDAYALAQKEKHEAEAAPLREERERLVSGEKAQG